MSGWKPEPARPRTKVLVAVAVAIALTVLVIGALVVPPRTVARVAVVTTPYAQIVGFLGGIAVIVTYIRKLVLSAVRATEDAAAANAEVASQQQEASERTGSVVEALTRQLAASQAARTVEADRNDKVFTALLESQAANLRFEHWVVAQNLPRRVRELENFAADQETEAHNTGQLRLHETALKQETDA